MVGFKHSVGFKTLLESTVLEHLKLCVSSHFAGSGSLCNFYGLLKYFEMTTAGTQYEKGSRTEDEKKS